MTDHTVKSFTEQLESLSALVAQMGGLAEAQFAAAIEAVARRDSLAAESAVGGDKLIHRPLGCQKLPVAWLRGGEIFLQQIGSLGCNR